MKTIYSIQVNKRKCQEFGTIDEGEFLKGNQHRKGKKIYLDKSEYEGDFVNGKEEGNGTKKWNVEQFRKYKQKKVKAIKKWVKTN